MIQFLNILFSMAKVMLWILKMSVLMSIFVPYSRMGMFGGRNKGGDFFSLVSELATPVYKATGKLVFGPIDLSPMLAFVFLNIILDRLG